MKSTKYVSIWGVLVVFGAALAQQAVAVTNFDDDMSTLATGWNQIVGTGTLAAGNLDPGVPAQTVMINNGASGTGTLSQNSAGFTAPVSFTNLTSLTAEFTLRANSVTPVNQVASQIQLQNSNAAVDGNLHYAIMTVRRQGTFEFGVFRWDAGLNSVNVLNVNLPGVILPGDYSNTLRIERDNTGFWSVTRTDTNTVIVSGTESTLITSGEINRIQINDPNRSTEPWAFHDHITITSENVPEPGSLALLGLGGLCMLRWRSRR